MTAAFLSSQANGKLSAMLEIRSTGLTKYLKTLIDLDILERELPVTEGNPEKTKGDYIKLKTITFDSGSLLSMRMSVGSGCGI